MSSTPHSICINCSKPIRAIHPSIPCDFCKNGLHYGCLGLPQEIVFSIIRGKSPYVKVLCSKCRIFDINMLNELKRTVEQITDELSKRITDLEENTIRKDNIAQIKEAIIAECVENLRYKDNEYSENDDTDKEKIYDNEQTHDAHINYSQVDSNNSGFTANKNDSFTILRPYLLKPWRRIHCDRSQNSRKSREFERFEKEFEWNPKRNYVRTIEIEYDLFLMSKEYSLGHCVAEDMNMGSGIAVRFRYEFKKVDELLNQGAGTGGLAVLKDNNRFIYYLVTKKLSTGKPTYETLFSSLEKMREHIIENNVKQLALPRIGCGLDRLHWDKVKFMIEFIFTEVDVEIKICNLQIEGSPQLRHKNSKLTNVTYPIHDIEEGTIIIYLTSEDGFISDEMKMLDEKFRFLIEFQIAVKTKGNVIFFTKNENYMLCGCIVKKTETDLVDFSAFQRCLSSIQKANKKYQFGYVGFQAVKDDDDSCFNSKIINLLRNNLRDTEVYICWPGDLQNDLIARDTPRTSLEQGSARRSLNQFYSGRESWQSSSPSTTSYNNKTYDSRREEQTRTPVLTEADWFEEGDSAKLRKNENNENNSNSRKTENTRVKIDWFAQDNNLGDSNTTQAEYTRKENKSHAQTDGWDDSDPEDHETSTSSKVERSRGMTKTKPEENLWQSNEQTDEDSFEDSLLHSKKKPKKNKDNLKYEENVWHAQDHSQAQKTNTDRWPNPDCKPYQPRDDVTACGENTVNDKYKQNSWYLDDYSQTQSTSDSITTLAENPVDDPYKRDAKDYSQTRKSEQSSWANPDCKPFQPRQSQNITVRKEGPVSIKYKKDSWHAEDYAETQYKKDDWTKPNRMIPAREKNSVNNKYERDSWHVKDHSQAECQRDVNVAEDRKDTWHTLTSQSAQSSQYTSHAYELYKTEKNIEIVTVREREIHDLPKKYSRACYVTADMSLISGIPFGTNFKTFIGELLSQNKKEGNVAIVKDGIGYVYCLIVKTSVTLTPTHHEVFSAIEQMRNHALKNHVKNIVVPKMENKSEDSFKWHEVKYMLEFLFKNRNIDIFLASFEQVRQKNRLMHVKAGLHQVKNKSIIIYWASEDDYLSDEMKSLCRKFEFVEEFKKKPKRLGDTIKYKQNEDHVLYGCIVKKLYSDPIDFHALQECLTKVNECNKTEKLAVVGVQAVRHQDETINFKIINVMMNILQDVTLNVCWPGDLKQKMPIV